MTESELSNLLDTYDGLLSNCANGLIAYADFLRLYDNFYDSYALDGHEADSDFRSVLDALQRRINVHARASQILSRACTDEDWKNPQYAKAGRHPPSEVVRQLRSLVAEEFEREFR